MQTTLEQQLRQAMITACECGSLNELASAAGLDWAQLQRFRDGKTLTLASASKLAAALDLELRPIARKSRRKPRIEVDS